MIITDLVKELVEGTWFSIEAVPGISHYVLGSTAGTPLSDLLLALGRVCVGGCAAAFLDMEEGAHLWRDE